MDSCIDCKHTGRKVDGFVMFKLRCKDANSHKHKILIMFERTKVYLFSSIGLLFPIVLEDTEDCKNDDVFRGTNICFLGTVETID